MTKALEKAFERYHDAHPEFYEAFDLAAKELIGRGYKRFSAIMLMGIVVWKREPDEPPLSVSTGLAAYFARYWLEKNPEHPEFFKLGKLKEH